MNLERIKTRAALRRAGEWMEARSRRGVCFLQHDYDVANGDGATVRGDINDALEAGVTNNSGATAPATTYAYMTWYDTTLNVKKRRNAANSAWVVDSTLAETFVVSRSSDTILASADRGKCIVATASFTQTLTAAATLTDGWALDYIVQEGATVVFDPNGAETIDGASTLTIVGPQCGKIHCNGTAFFTSFPPVWPQVIAYNSAADTNQTGNVATVTVDYNTEIVDTGADFASDTFTAPSTGRYLVVASARVTDLSTAMKGCFISIVASNRTYVARVDYNVETAADNVGLHIAQIVDMDAADTVFINVTVTGGAGDTADINGAADDGGGTFLSIMRVA